MMNSYVLLVDPIALARARHGRGKTWDSQKNEKMYYGFLLSQLHRDRPLFKGPLHMEVVFYIKIPKSSKNKMQEMEGKWHSTKPDNSNLLKFIEDVGVGILYHDDAIICSQVIQKKYSDSPRIELLIKEMS
jgi:Holliday junction resolvase RusA-like endonuclease